VGGREQQETWTLSIESGVGESHLPCQSRSANDDGVGNNELESC
jgi:hypothetical protein